MTLFLNSIRARSVEQNLLLSAFLVLPLIISSISGAEPVDTLTQDIEVASIENNASEQEAANPVVDPKVLAFQDALTHFIKAAKGSLDVSDRDGIAAFYAHNGHQRIWLEDGQFNHKARALIFKISRADEYGLNGADYDLPRLNLGQNENLSLLELIDAELKMSLSVVRYVRHVASGRLVPQSISASLDLNPERPDPAQVLAALYQADDSITQLSDYHPKHPQYQALLKQLAQIRLEKAQQSIVIGPGKLLKPGMADNRVPLLRARLKVAPPASETNAAEGENNASADIDEMIYDAVLVAAVKDFQRENGLARDGIVGPRTVQALNGDTKLDRVHQILVNLERWRWMPKDLGQFHILVNIPEFKTFVIQDHQVIHETRVVVGKVANKTVVFSDKMEHFVVNPAWGVPKSIIREEMLPAARANPSYFSRRGYQVYARIRGRTRRVDPSLVNWSMVNASQISVRQPPGARNALGQIKFMFPNKHSIYMHDTPSKSLFKRSVRAFSHGCVRVHNPLEFADAILQNEAQWNSDRIRKMIGGRESTVELKQHIPVHIAYFTAKVDPSGELIIHNDIYGHDRRMIRALGF